MIFSSFFLPGGNGLFAGLLRRKQMNTGNHGTAARRLGPAGLVPRTPRGTGRNGSAAGRARFPGAADNLDADHAFVELGALAHSPEGGAYWNRPQNREGHPNDLMASRRRG